MPEMPPEEEVIEDLMQAGIARPIYEHDRAGQICLNPKCEEEVPENSYKKMNLGAKTGFCSLGCKLEYEDND